MTDNPLAAQHGYNTRRGTRQERSRTPSPPRATAQSQSAITTEELLSRLVSRLDSTRPREDDLTLRLERRAISHLQTEPGSPWRDLDWAIATLNDHSTYLDTVMQRHDTNASFNSTHSTHLTHSSRSEESRQQRLNLAIQQDQWHRFFIPNSGTLRSVQHLLAHARVRSDQHAVTWRDYGAAIIAVFVQGGHQPDVLIQSELQALRPTAPHQLQQFLAKFNSLRALRNLIGGGPQPDAVDITALRLAFSHLPQFSSTVSRQLTIQETITGRPVTSFSEFEQLLGNFETEYNQSFHTTMAIGTLNDPGPDDQDLSGQLVAPLGAKRFTPQMPRLRPPMQYPTRLSHGQNVCLAFAFKGICPRGDNCKWKQRGGHDEQVITAYRAEIQEEANQLDHGAAIRAAATHQRLQQRQ